MRTMPEVFIFLKRGDRCSTRTEKVGITPKKCRYFLITYIILLSKVPTKIGILPAILGKFPKFNEVSPKIIGDQEIHKISRRYFHFFLSV